MTMMVPQMKFNPNTGEVAIKTATGVAYSWFVFDPVNGGYPTSSAKVEQWEELLWPVS